jgi:inhibitor of KinA
VSEFPHSVSLTRMSAAYPTPRFLNAGEATLVVEFGSTVDPMINDRVIDLDQQITDLALPGILETVPTYRSLMIHYDPLVIDRESLIAQISATEPHAGTRREPKTLWSIPCCYKPPHAEDLSEIAKNLSLSEADVISLHSTATFRAYMYGFAPGFCYLGGLPKELGISRRPMPRSPHPPNAILIAGGLSLIGTFPMPTGWWVIGRTPVRLFSPSRNPNFLVKVGDLVRFIPIGAQEFDSLETDSNGGKEIAEQETLQ